VAEPRSEPMSLEVEIVLENPDWSAIADLDGRIVHAARTALEQAAVTVQPGCELAVLLTDDAAIGALNARWRNKDMPTNVLSFPAVALDRIATSPVLGDIALAYETCAREAQVEARPLVDHILHLVVHGVLHLVGYDHQTEAEATTMEDLERTILARLGVPDPYSAADSSGASL